MTFDYQRNNRGAALAYDNDELEQHNSDTAAEGAREVENPRTTKFATYARASTKAKVPVRRELVQDLIPLGSVGFIGGQSGAFKTFWALDLAAEVATGGSIAGKRVFRAGAVVYLAYEGQGTLDERWAAICRDKRMKGFPPVFLVRDAKPLSDADAWEALHEMLLDIRDDLRADDTDLQLLIIDTVNMSGMIPDDRENDSGTWGKVFTLLGALAKGLGCSIALVHHAGKDVQAGLRGSSAAHAAADFVIMCEAERDAVSGEVSNRWLHLRKSRYGVEGPIAQMSSESVVVTENEQGEPVSTLVMRYDTAATYVAPARDGKPARNAEPPVTENKRKLMRLYGEMAVKIGAGKWEVEIASLKERWIADYRGRPKAAAQAFKRALEGDEKHGLKGLTSFSPTNKYQRLGHTLEYWGTDDSDTPVIVGAFGVDLNKTTT
jgi:hypothetical protein